MKPTDRDGVKLIHIFQVGELLKVIRVRVFSLYSFFDGFIKVTSKSSSFIILLFTNYVRVERTK